MIKNGASLNTAVIAIFAFRSWSRSSCPLMDFLADNRYIQKACFKPSRNGKAYVDFYCFAIILVLSILQISAKPELICSPDEKIECPIIHCGR